MSWEEAFNHPLLHEGISFTNAFKGREDKENRTPRQVLMDMKEKERLRSKSRYVSAKKIINLSNISNQSNLSKTPRSRVLRNIDLTPDRNSPWKI